VPTKDEQILDSWNRRKGGLPHLDYAFVPESKVDPDLLKAARLGHRFACFHLGLERVPAMRFYRQRDEHAGRGLGFSGNDRGGHADAHSWSIGLRTDTAQGREWMVEVAAHEVRHLMQKAVDEHDAEQYGLWAADVLVRRRGRYKDLAPSVHSWEGAVQPRLTLYGKGSPRRRAGGE
jgi:hypothetical protein